MNKIINALKTFVFGEEEEKQPKGRVYIVTPSSRVKFEADLTVREDFERAIDLLDNEIGIMFPRKDDF